MDFGGNISITDLDDKIPETPENQLTISTILSITSAKELEAENGKMIGSLRKTC